MFWPRIFYLFVRIFLPGSETSTFFCLEIKALKMPTAYDFADSENELFTFGDKTFYDAIHGVGVFEEFNPDGEYVPNIYLLSKSIQSKNILEIPILKA